MRTWTTLALVAVYGAGLFAAGWIRGDHAKAIQVAAFVLVLVIVLLLLMRRSEWFRQQTVEPDERVDLIDTVSIAWAGFVVFWVLATAFLIEWGRGNSGEPYYWLLLVWVGAYAAGAVLQRLRR
jgi:hypothetical protein